MTKLSIILKPGKYTITTIYEGLSIGNNIDVLSTWRQVISL